MNRIYKLVSLNLLILACLCLIITLSGQFYYKTKKLLALNEWVAHTQKTLIYGYSILSDELLMRLATQEFIVTGNKVYLTAYQQLIQAINHDVHSFKILTLDNPSQQNRLDELQTLMQQETNAVNTTIANKQNNLIKLDLTHPKSGQTFSEVPKSNDITQIVDKILFEEKNLLTARSKELFRNLIILNQVGLIADTISLVVIFICLLLLNRQLIMHFITEKKLEKSEKRFKILAYTDYITGLKNRVSLIDTLNKLIEKTKNTSSKLALFYIDLDNFKKINDSFGHEMGDQLLRATADKIKNTFENIPYIFRISGDEFVIVLDNLKDQNEIANLAQKLLTTFSKPIDLNGHKMMCTISIGVSIFPDFAHDAESLLRNADIAMYKSKQVGKNSYQFSNFEMIKEFNNNTRLYYELQNAVMNKEFTLVYQPKLSLKTNQLSGLEALIRWKQTDVGLIYPSEFITIAENNGLIIPIGKWVMRNVCLQAKQWQQAGIKVANVAFNVSIREFLMRDFSNTITKIIDETGIDPHSLEIEITETILMEDFSKHFSSLKYLKSLGVKITIDDFGTGYSSLNYLTMFPVDKLKIDKSFIAQISETNPEPVIITAIISMAHQLGIQVVAEGVETQMQLDFIKRAQCDEIQGYHYSKPLFVEEVPEFIINQHK